MTSTLIVVPDYRQLGQIYFVMESTSETFDAVIVGASLAGCTAATLLARQGASVLLVDKRPDPNAYKVVCGHYIQASALPTIRRLGLYEPMIDAGAVHSPAKLCWDGDPIGPVPAEVAEASINLPRRKLDPLIRGIAAETPGVDLRLGWTLNEIDRDGEIVVTKLSGPDGEALSARSRLIVGADGRDSTVAKLIDARTITSKNGRFNYSPFYSGPPHSDFPATTSWFIGDEWAGAFPTSGGLTGYYLMPKMRRLEEFKADVEGSCLRMIATLPGAPPVDQLELAGPIVGRVDMTNIWRSPIKRGVALIGDAALSIDPLYGVGCGWALQSGEMLAEAVGESLVKGASLDRGLRAYRRRIVFEIYPHGVQGAGYSRGRPLSRMERFVMKRAARDAGVEEQMIRIVTRSVSPFELMGPKRTLQLLRA